MYAETIGPLIGDVGYVRPGGLGQYSFMQARARILAAQIRPDLAEELLSGENGESGMSSMWAFDVEDVAEAAQDRALEDAKALQRGEVPPPPTPAEVGLAPAQLVATPEQLVNGTAVDAEAPLAPQFVEQIAAGPAGDVVESVGLPRESAPWIIGALAAAGIIWGIQGGRRR